MAATHILLVEDDIITQQRLIKQLDILGYQVVAAIKRGEEAIQHLEKHQPDVVLLDIELEGEMNGIQVGEVIMQRWQLPIVYLTAFTDVRTLEQVKHTQPAYFLPKPYTIQHLTVAINYALVGNIERSPKPPLLLTRKNALFIHKKDKYEKVLVDEILWIQANGSSVIINTEQKKKYVISVNLKTLCAQFTHPYLLRVNRSYLINIEKVSAINGRQLVVDSESILCSPQYIPSLQKYFPIIKSRE